MRRSVLLGGRTGLRRRREVRHALVVWAPVVLMLLVIARESTAAFGSMNTSSVLRPIYEAIVGIQTDQDWELAHHYIRKTGHFLGYGLLGVAWLRAYLLTWMWSFRQQAAHVWRRWSLQMAICCTAVVASLDEVHQSYIPDRTGMVTDVLLDTAGALVLCGACALFWMMHSSRGAVLRTAPLAA